MRVVLRPVLPQIGLGGRGLHVTHPQVPLAQQEEALRSPLWPPTLAQWWTPRARAFEMLGTGEAAPPLGQWT